jgi:hypothetical protein
MQTWCGLQGFFQLFNCQTPDYEGGLSYGRGGEADCGLTYNVDKCIINMQKSMDKSRELIARIHGEKPKCEN